jgi:hypothetical protein
MIQFAIVYVLKVMEVVIICRFSLEVSLRIRGVFCWGVFRQLLSDEFIVIVCSSIKLKFSSTRIISLARRSLWDSVKLSSELSILSNVVSVVRSFT